RNGVRAWLPQHDRRVAGRARRPDRVVAVTPSPVEGCASGGTVTTPTQGHDRPLCWVRGGRAPLPADRWSAPWDASFRRSDHLRTTPTGSATSERGNMADTIKTTASARRASAAQSLARGKTEEIMR